MSDKKSTAQQAALSPTQEDVLAELRALTRAAPVLGLIHHPGTGGSMVLQRLADEVGGYVLNAQDMIRVTTGHPAAQYDDLIFAEMSRCLEEYPLLALDDLGQFQRTSAFTGQRPLWSRLIRKRLTDQAQESGHRLIMSGTPLDAWETWADRFGPAAIAISMRAFGPQDYAVIGANIVGADKLANVDFKQLHRYASQLSGYQLRLGFRLLAGRASISTDDVIECFARQTSSNTRISEVEAVRFEQLPGHEAIIETLQTHIVMPMENRELAQRLGLRPKRGVLLFGPPGTGKTSIGRALAHRMKGKFFLIDGSFVSEPPAAFFGKLEAVIADAKKNAPSVLFIDDADTLFRIEHIAGLSRYLLTLLDGLESLTASHVCVMMTAMDVRPIPEAVLRSGRVELWLETRAPEAPVRARILERWLDNALPQAEQVDFAAIAQETEGFTPADIRRLVSDAKTLYAADVAHKRMPGSASSYLHRAVEAIVAMRSRMAECLQDESLRLKGHRAAATAPSRYPANHNWLGF